MSNRSRAARDKGEFSVRSLFEKQETTREKKRGGGKREREPSTVQDILRALVWRVIAMNHEERATAAQRRDEDRSRDPADEDGSDDEDGDS